ANLPLFFPHPKVLAAIATSGVILSAVYMLFLYQKVFYGPLNNTRNRELKDLTTREVAVFAPILVAAFWLGLYPNTFLSKIDPAVTHTIAAFKAKFVVSAEENMSPTLIPELGSVPPTTRPPEFANPQPTDTPELVP
ncbi:MAG TPA: hypothetical protein VFF06_33700, partial [Polyangia bacterium]|nr:hypothetical protein [Polyangia bacterium]